MDTKLLMPSWHSAILSFILAAAGGRCIQEQLDVISHVWLDIHSQELQEQQQRPAGFIVWTSGSGNLFLMHHQLLCSWGKQQVSHAELAFEHSFGPVAGGIIWAVVHVIWCISSGCRVVISCVCVRTC